MESRRNLILLGIALTVLPSTFCVIPLAAGNLSNGVGVALDILVILPAMVLIGSIIGLGTSVLLSKTWLVVVGTQLGWLGGLLTIGLVGKLLQIGPHDSFVSIGAYLLLICSGIIIGLSPALIVRFIKGGR